MILLPRPRWVYVLLLSGNAVAWIVPSHVVELVARDHQTLLGRYSFPHFMWNVALLAATAIALYIGRTADARSRRVRGFRVVALLTSMLLGAILIDIPLRIKFPPTYKLDRLAFRRPPGVRWEAKVDDAPEARRSYPVVQPGFGHADCIFTIDANGYRNQSLRSQYDVVALGDSFTEGSLVSDNQPWPVVFSRLSGFSVYNAGMSGYSPQHYLAALRAEGVRLSPKWVICTLYEGNDFKTTETITGSQLRVKQLFRSSPVVQLMDRVLISTLGRIGAHADVKGLDTLSWLPLGVPEGANAKYYAFSPKDVTDLCSDADQFRQGRKWKIVADSLEALRRTCEQNGAKLVLVYVPAKPRVVLPLAAGWLPAEKVRAFLAINTNTQLPEAKSLMRELLPRMEVRESVVAEWCRANSVRFVSLTATFRKAARAGRQAYFTYDQHWTPVGHEIAAEAIWANISK